MGLAESEMNNEDSEYVEDSGSDDQDENGKTMEMEKDSKIILSRTISLSKYLIQKL